MIIRQFLGPLSTISDVRHITDDRRIVQHLRDTHGILSSHKKSQIDANPFLQCMYNQKLRIAVETSQHDLEETMVLIFADENENDEQCESNINN